MPRRNPYYPGMSGQSVYDLDPAPPDFEPKVKRDPARGIAADGYKVNARRPRYGRPGEIMSPAKASEYDDMYEQMGSYDEED